MKGPVQQQLGRPLSMANIAPSTTSWAGTTLKPFGGGPTILTEMTEMGHEEDVELIRRGYEAFSAGDVATLTEIFAENAVWYVPGSGVLSGTKQGRDAVLAYFADLGTRSDGSLKVTVQEIIGGENHTVALQHNHAETNGKTLDTDGALAFVVRDGKITEGREFYDDTAQGDAFWG